MRSGTSISEFFNREKSIFSLEFFPPKTPEGESKLHLVRERFSEALMIEPGHVEATWQLAMLDMEEGAYDRAVVGFEACMDADDTYSNGLFFTARCYEAMGKPEAAVIRYQQYLPYAPDTIISARVLDFITRLESGESSGSNE